jgi:hypothetical protein
MYHIALYTPCIALLLVSHTCAFCDRPRGVGTRGVDEASSSRRPGALTNDPCLLLLNLALCSFMIVN